MQMAWSEAMEKPLLYFPLKFLRGEWVLLLTGGYSLVSQPWWSCFKCIILTVKPAGEKIPLMRNPWEGWSTVLTALQKGFSQQSRGVCWGKAEPRIPARFGLEETFKSHPA